MFGGGTTTRHCFLVVPLAGLASLCFIFHALKQTRSLNQVYGNSSGGGGGTLENKSLSLQQAEEYKIFQDPNLSPNDSTLLTYVRTRILHPPLPIPYNLRNPTADPSSREGQNQHVLNLLKHKVSHAETPQVC